MRMRDHKRRRVFQECFPTSPFVLEDFCWVLAFLRFGAGVCNAVRAFQFCAHFGLLFLHRHRCQLKCGARLAAAGSRIVVEKDWTVVIAAGSEDSLASLNSVFRSLDLVCANVTPVLAGLLFR